MKISVEVLIKSDLVTVWEAWNTPDAIKKWNAASPDWQTTSSQLDLRKGGRFITRMEAKDGSQGFDFSGQYTRVVQCEIIEYLLDDGRSVRIEFSKDGSGVKIVETFEAEFDQYA